VAVPVLDREPRCPVAMHMHSEEGTTYCCSGMHLQRQLLAGAAHRPCGQRQSAAAAQEALFPSEAADGTECCRPNHQGLVSFRIVCQDPRPESAPQLVPLPAAAGAAEAGALHPRVAGAGPSAGRERRLLHKLRRTRCSHVDIYIANFLIHVIIVCGGA